MKFDHVFQEEEKKIVHKKIHCPSTPTQSPNPIAQPLSQLPFLHLPPFVGNHNDTWTAGSSSLPHQSLRESRANIFPTAAKTPQIQPPRLGPQTRSLPSRPSLQFPSHFGFRCFLEISYSKKNKRRASLLTHWQRSDPKNAPPQTLRMLDNPKFLTLKISCQSKNFIKKLTRNCTESHTDPNLWSLNLWAHQPVRSVAPTRLVPPREYAIHWWWIQILKHKYNGDPGRHGTWLHTELGYSRY